MESTLKELADVLETASKLVRKLAEDNEVTIVAQKVEDTIIARQIYQRAAQQATNGNKTVDS